MMTERRCALVTFLMRSSAEEAAKALYRNLSVHNQQLKLWWAKSKAADAGGNTRHGQQGGSSSAPAGPPPLPGAKVEAGQLRSLYPSMNPNAMGARPDH